MNYLIWNEQDSRDIKGLIICELPPITKPQMRVNEISIDGVDGSIIEELGYSSYDRPLVIGITQNADIDEISQYFNGSGDVVFSNEPDKYYKASIIGQIDYARLLRFRTATVVFRVQPFKYEYLEQEQNITEGQAVYNNGNYFSEPIMEINGTGEVVVAINGNTTFRYIFPDDEDTVVIDSKKQDAYLGKNLKNRNMMGEFPIFTTGKNIITWDGAVSSIKITSKSRWL